MNTPTRSVVLLLLASFAGCATSSTPAIVDDFVWDNSAGSILCAERLGKP